MVKLPEARIGIAWATAEIAIEGICLRRMVTFRNDGLGERICSHCQGSVVWRTASAVCSGNVAPALVTGCRKSR